MICHLSGLTSHNINFKISHNIQPINKLNMKLHHLIAMKAALLILGLSFPNALATDKELLYGLDFNDLASNNSLVNTATTTPGESALTNTGGWINYSSNTPGSNSGLSHSFNNPAGQQGATFRLGSTTSTTAIAGLEGDAGLTLNISTSLLGNADWKAPVSFIYGETTFTLQIGFNSSTIYLRNESAGNNVSSIDTGSLVGTWTSLSVTMSGENMSLTAVDSTGSLIGTAAGSVAGLTDTGLTYVSGGGYGLTGFDRRHANILTDDLSIYNGVLTQEEILLVANASMNGTGAIQTIPEPSTATLSILALAGFMSRRRRK